MSLRFASGPSSTKFAVELLRPYLPDLKLGAPGEWRQNYQRAFVELTRLEAQTSETRLQAALLEAIGASILDDAGRSITQLVKQGWSQGQLVETVVVSGMGETSRLATVGKPTAEALVRNGLAEPRIADDLSAYDDWVAAHDEAPTAGELLLAIGANAELSLVADWLAIGGIAAAIARQNSTKWSALIAQARESGGTLLVPVLATRAAGLDLASIDDEQLAQIAGLDLQADLAAIAGWVRSIADAHIDKRIVALGTVYAPGKNQILAAAAQDALLARLTDELPPARLVLGWLATPLDSVALPREVFEASIAAHAKRGLGRRIRDLLLRPVGGPLAPHPEAILTSASDRDLAIVDFSAVRQGSSYLLAKRIERWRAQVAQAAGHNVWFQVAPPAQTHSTLDYRVVRAAFRGAGSFGVTTFVPWMLRDLLTAVLIGHLKGEAKQPAKQPAEQPVEPRALLDSAIHGGVWRVAYDPQSIWSPAAILGWPELLRGGK